MEHPNQKDWLDKAILRTTPGTPAQPNFAQWRNTYAHALDTLKLRAQQKTRYSYALPAVIEFGRQIMQSKYTRIAAVVVLALVVVPLTGIFNELTSPAYALEQSIKASHSMRYLRMKVYEPGHETPKAFWVAFAQDGDIKRLRADFPQWAGEGDGPSIIVFNEGIVDVWYKHKKTVIRMSDRSFADKTLQAVIMFEPKGMLERLLAAKHSGLVDIEIDKPDNKAEPIVVTATSLPEDTTMPGRRGVVFIDQSTKLVTHIELYLLKGSEYEYSATIEFSNYNQPIDPKMFNLDEAPSNLERIDYTTQEIGLIQRNLTDSEIAVKCVRQFYEALIAKDYAKAGQVYGGWSAARTRKEWESTNVLRIISISEPIPHPHPNVGGFQVHCEIEIEKDGVKSVLKPYGPGVRPVKGQSHRWNIHGGVK
jgi:hypothetical protein